MNPWIYTQPSGGSSDEFDVDSLKYEDIHDFIEENNHPGRMEDGQVRHICLCTHCVIADSHAVDPGSNIY